MKLSYISDISKIRKFSIIRQFQQCFDNFGRICICRKCRNGRLLTFPAIPADVPKSAGIVEDICWNCRRYRKLRYLTILVIFANIVEDIKSIDVRYFQLSATIVEDRNLTYSTLSVNVEIFEVVSFRKMPELSKHCRNCQKFLDSGYYSTCNSFISLFYCSPRTVQVVSPSGSGFTILLLVSPSLAC